MKKPRPKTKPAKPRKKARVVISGAGTTQRPLDPLTARFASRISKVFSGDVPD